LRTTREAALDARGRVSGGSDPTLSTDLNDFLDEAEKQAQALGDVDVFYRKLFDPGTSALGDGFEGRCGLLIGWNCDADVVEHKTVYGSMQ
jgi:hypothetical protein